VIVPALAERTNPDAATPTANTSKDPLRVATCCNNCFLILSLLFMIFFFRLPRAVPVASRVRNGSSHFQRMSHGNPGLKCLRRFGLDHTLCGALVVIPISPNILYRSSYLYAAGPQNRKIWVQRPASRAWLQRDRRLSLPAVREDGPPRPYHFIVDATAQLVSGHRLLAAERKSNLG
jgi:hypothetical protein